MERKSMEKVRNTIFITIVIFIVSISLLYSYLFPNSQIPISNNIEIALGIKNNRNYILLLNKSIDGDSISLSKFLKIDYIYDAAAYDHGYILLQLLEKIGDTQLSKELQKLNKTEIKTVQNYFNLGMDGIDSQEVQQLQKNYPKSFEILKIRK